jgi:tetratricopeptide (TPR) repeat protein
MTGGPAATAAAAGAPAGAPGGATGAPGARPVALRLARVHLRLGSLLLARAELESFAGRGVLDEDALLDLAEVRWRTGDLAGAGEAAHALLERGSTDALALVISAEAVAAEGRPGEARRLAVRAMAQLDGPLDTVFAGQPRSSVWPLDVAPTAVAAAALPGARPAVRAGRRRPGSVASAATEDETPASAAAAEALAGGLAALGGGDTATAALRLGVALRLEPDYATAVLDAIGDRTDPGLALVAGDAYRLLGREAEALDAFDRARGHG